jgi:hypothetical protein
MSDEREWDSDAQEHRACSHDRRADVHLVCGLTGSEPAIESHPEKDAAREQPRSAYTRHRSADFFETSELHGRVLGMRHRGNREHENR